MCAALNRLCQQHKKRLVLFIAAGITSSDFGCLDKHFYHSLLKYLFLCSKTISIENHEKHEKDLFSS